MVARGYGRRYRQGDATCADRFNHRRCTMGPRHEAEDDTCVDRRPAPTFPSPPSAFRAGGEGQGERRLRAGSRQELWLREIGIGSEQAAAPHPRPARTPASPPPPNRRGEGNRAHPLPFRERRCTPTSPSPSSSGLARGPMVPRSNGRRPGKAARRAPTPSTIDAARWVLGTRPRMTPASTPRGDLSLSPKRVWRVGGRGLG